jgi:hypothetical protein
LRGFGPKNNTDEITVAAAAKKVHSSENPNMHDPPNSSDYAIRAVLFITDY